MGYFIHSCVFIPFQSILGSKLPSAQIPADGDQKPILVSIHPRIQVALGLPDWDRLDERIQVSIHPRIQVALGRRRMQPHMV